MQLTPPIDEVSEPEVAREMRETVRFESKLRDITVRDEDGKQFSAEVLDESFGGLGLRIGTKQPVEVGAELELTYNGVRMWAKLQNIAPAVDGSERWGMAWKAVGIASRARRICEPVHVHDSSDPAKKHLARFVDMLPGGLYMMWNLFEHAKWRELDEAADRLAGSAKRCGLQSIGKPVELLRHALRKGVRLGELRKLLDELVEFCLDETDKFVKHVNRTP